METNLPIGHPISHQASNLCKVGRCDSGLEPQGDQSWMFQNGNETSSHFVVEIGKDVQNDLTEHTLSILHR